MHGPHHVAQNSTTYTLPGTNFVTGLNLPFPLLIQCSMLIGGALEPIVSSTVSAAAAFSGAAFPAGDLTAATGFSAAAERTGAAFP